MFFLCKKMFTACGQCAAMKLCSIVSAGTTEPSNEHHLEWTSCQLYGKSFIERNRMIHAWCLHLRALISPVTSSSMHCDHRHPRIQPSHRHCRQLQHHCGSNGWWAAGGCAWAPWAAQPAPVACLEERIGSSPSCCIKNRRANQRICGADCEVQYRSCLLLRSAAPPPMHIHAPDSHAISSLMLFMLAVKLTWQLH